MSDDEKKDEAINGEPTSGSTPPNTSEGSPKPPEQCEKVAAGSDASSEEKPKPSKPWPLRGIKEPHDHDVLYGRGGGTNHHIGNKRYRKMVEDRKVDYVNSKRLDKPLVALDIIRTWRAQDPPGRFLKLDEKTGLWHDVGDKKAREKTSQALREKAPELRKQQEVERLRKEGKLGSDEELEETETEAKPKASKQKVKKTAFDVPEGEPKKRDSKDLKHLMLARDHSLGRDYLKPDESVGLDGFSWDEPVGQIAKIYGDKQGSSGRPRQERVSYPPSQAEGWGSGRFSKIEPTSSMPPPPPPPPGPYASRSGGTPADFQSMVPPAETKMSREHSLAMNPLTGAAVDGPARDPFSREGKSVSTGGLDEAWPRGGPQMSAAHAPMPPPSQPYGFPPPPRQTSQPRFLGNEGSSAFSRTPSGQGDDRSRRSSATMEDIPQRSRSNSGRGEYGKPSSYGTAGPVRREWSSQSDDYRKVAGMVGDDLYDIRRSWSGQSDDYNWGAPYPPQDGRPYSGHDKWSSQSRPYSAAIREGRPPDYGPPPPPPQPYSAPQHGSPPRGAPPHGPYRHPLRRESSDRMSVDESKPASTAPAPSDSAVAPKEKVGSGKTVPQPSLRRKLSGGGVTPRSHQPLDPQKGLARPQVVKRDTSHQCENDETKSRVKRTFLSRDHSLAGHKLNNSDVTESLTKAVFSEEETMKNLETSMQKSNLSSSITSTSSAVKPSAVSADCRLTTADAIGMAFADDMTARIKPTSSDQGERASPDKGNKPKAISSKSRLSTADAIGLVFAKPERLTEDQRLTSLGDPLDGGDLLIDPVTTEEALGGFDMVSEGPGVKPDRLSANERLSTVDALLMDIEKEAAVISKPGPLTASKRTDTIDAITNGLGDDAIAKAWLGESN